VELGRAGGDRDSGCGVLTLMDRVSLAPRSMWRTRVEAVGFHFHTIDGQPYWTEDAGYRLCADQAAVLESATAELHRMCVDLVERVVRRGDAYQRLGLNHQAAALIERSWNAGERGFHGRMDLVFDGRNPPQLLEYNADTPTALIEAAVVQWHWLRDRFPDKSQFNSIHEKLIAAWRGRRGASLQPPDVHFASHSKSPEDFATAEYLRDTCIQGGLLTHHLDIADIDWKDDSFIDLRNRPIRTLFKLYPWEWLLAEPFGQFIAQGRTRWIEPAWKMLLSNKTMLPLLCEMFPRHPNLLPAASTRAAIIGDAVAKPAFGHGGEGVQLLPAGQSLPKLAAESGLWVYQAYRPLPSFNGRHPVIDSWVIDDKPAGIGIREDATPITRGTGAFVPHWIA
jgi:glutathionylspermidine synthase